MPYLNLHASVPVKKCLLCGGKKFAQFAQLSHFGIHLEYDICRYCSLVFMSPRFSEQDIEHFYKEDYRLLYGGDANPTQENLSEQKLRAEHLAEVLNSRIEGVHSHLDIGSSTGEFLLEIRTMYPSIQSVGIEPSAAHREWCSGNGWLVYASLEEMSLKVQKPFELISLSHVLEHLPDPVRYLEELRLRFLAPNGYLLIEVPNLLGHASFEIAHLVCFWEKTLKETLNSAGYEVLLTKIHGIPRKYEKSRRYLTVLAMPEQDRSGRKIKPIWWRVVQVHRLKGLSGYNWFQIALRFPRKIMYIIRHELLER